MRTKRLFKTMFGSAEKLPRLHQYNVVETSNRAKKNIKIERERDQGILLTLKWIIDDLEAVVATNTLRISNLEDATVGIKQGREVVNS